MALGTAWNGFVSGIAGNAVSFDGTNDYLSRGADLTGNADSKIWSGSIWFKYSGGDPYIFVSQSPGGNRVRITSGSSGVQLTAFNTTPSAIISTETTEAPSTGVWHHLLWSFDLSDTGKRNMYLDDSALTVNYLSYDTTQNIDHTRPDHYIAAINPSSLYAIDLANVWIDHAQYLDITQESVRRKFIDANGRPVDLGTTGTAPTGTAPIMLFQGNTSEFHINKGTGGGFTENGELTTASTSPWD